MIKRLYLGLIALGAVGAVAGLAGLTMLGESAGPEPTMAEMSEAKAALKEAALIEDAAVVARQNVHVFRTELQPYLPGGPADYRAVLAASQAEIEAAEAYATWLRVAAADGRISETERAEIEDVRTEYETAQDAAYEALMASPAAELVEFQDALIESWVDMGKVSRDGRCARRRCAGSVGLCHRRQATTLACRPCLHGQGGGAFCLIFRARASRQSWPRDGGYSERRIAATGREAWR